MTTGGTQVTEGNEGDEPLGAWAQQMRAEGLSRRTTTEWPRVVRRAARWVDAEPDRLTTESIIDYLAGLPSASTRQTYYSALQAWHRWLLATGRRTDNPLAALRRPRAPRREPHPVATGHLEALLGSGIRRRTRTAVLLCAYEGLRVHEAAKVRGEDIDFVGQRLRVVGKGGVEKWIPLHPAIATEARRYPRRGYWFPSPKRPGRPIRRDSLSAAISRAMRRCDIPGTAHSLRHWFGTELMRSGANAREAQELLRHANLNTVAIYTLVAAEAQHAAINRLPIVTFPTSRTATERTAS
jgi:integrase